MTLRLGGDGAITGCTSLENPDLTVSGLTISGSFDAEKVLVASGTAAAPSYTFSGDTDNGLYYAGTNSIGLSTAGTNAILIDSSRRVGIGNTVMSSFTGNSSDNLVVGSGSGGEGITIYSATNNQGSITFADGTSGNAAYRGAVEYSHTGDYLAFRTAGTGNRMIIDSAGRVGIGTTAPVNRIVIASTGATPAYLQSVNASSGVGATDGVVMGLGSASDVYYWNYENGSQIWATNAIERMRIDSAGLVGIGTSSPVDENNFTQSLNLNGTSGASFVAKNNNSSTNCGQFGYYGTTCYMINKAAGKCVFYTTNAEHAQLNAAGYFFASPGGPTTYYGDATPAFHSFDQVGVAQWTAGFRNSHTSPYGLVIRYSGASPNGTSNQFIYASDATSLKFAVKSNGGIENYSSNNSSLCDEREKKNIVSLETKWDKVKNWELRKFHYNEDADTDDLRYGVIAQEVEIENPELITDFTKQRGEDAVLDEDGTVVTPAKEEILRKGVKEQQMMWMAIKALQEAMVKIETLEQRLSDAGIA